MDRAIKYKLAEDGEINAPPGPPLCLLVLFPFCPPPPPSPCNLPIICHGAIIGLGAAIYIVDTLYLR